MRPQKLTRLELQETSSKARGPETWVAIALGRVADEGLGTNQTADWIGWPSPWKGGGRRSEVRIGQRMVRVADALGRPAVEGLGHEPDRGLIAGGGRPVKVHG